MSDTTEKIETKIEFLKELKDSTSADLRSLEETIKRIEGFSVGCKDTADKFDKFVAKVQNEYAVLASEGKIHPTVQSLLSNSSVRFLNFIKENAIEADKMLCVRRGEVLALSSRVQNFELTLKQLNEKIGELEAAKNAPVPTFTEALEQNGEELKEDERVRPDMDASTAVGRAALDIKKRKMKAKESSSEVTEEKLHKKSRKNTKKS